MIRERRSPNSQQDFSFIARDSRELRISASIVSLSTRLNLRRPVCGNSAGLVTGIKPSAYVPFSAKSTASNHKPAAILRASKASRRRIMVAGMAT